MSQSLNLFLEMKFMMVFDPSLGIEVLLPLLRYAMRPVSRNRHINRTIHLDSVGNFCAGRWHGGRMLFIQQFN